MMHAFIPPAPSLITSFTTSIASRRRRPAKTSIKRPTCSLAAPTSASGTITVQCDVNEIAAGDTLMIEYTPKDGSPFLSDKTATILWTGGFNGWKGEEPKPEETDDGSKQTLYFPFTPLLDGRYRVSIMVPNYATSVDFCVTSTNGWAWDDNNGAMYTIPVKYRKKLDKDGNIVEFVANDESEEVKRDAKVEEDGPRILVAEDEATLHRLRGEAALVGEEKGLGNILISHARDTFDRFDCNRAGTITAADVGEALKCMSFDLNDIELNDLIKKFVKDGNKVTMVEFMLIYSELEANDYGLDMV